MKSFLDYLVEARAKKRGILLGPSQREFYKNFAKAEIATILIKNRYYGKTIKNVINRAIEAEENLMREKAWLESGRDEV